MQARLARDGEIGRRWTERPTRSIRRTIGTSPDDKRALSIAGVMGGGDTGCTETTRNVFIESAMVSIRNGLAATGRKLGIQSDARYRFERGTDPEFVVPRS